MRLLRWHLLVQAPPASPPVTGACPEATHLIQPAAFSNFSWRSSTSAKPAALSCREMGPVRNAGGSGARCVRRQTSGFTGVGADRLPGIHIASRRFLKTGQMSVASKKTEGKEGSRAGPDRIAWAGYTPGVGDSVTVSGTVGRRKRRPWTNVCDHRSRDVGPAARVRYSERGRGERRPSRSPHSPPRDPRDGLLTALGSTLRLAWRDCDSAGAAGVVQVRACKAIALMVVLGA